jgi:hypothetical protein
VLAYIRNRVRTALDPDKVRRYLFKTSDKKTICGILVGVLSSTDEDQALVFERIEKALQLIDTYDPRRFIQIQRYIKSIFVFGNPTAYGYWHQSLQMCELQETFVRTEDTSVSRIASAIIHEAAHARLMRLGFVYEEPKRLRIEHICFDAERAFVRRLPDGEELTKEIDEKQAYYGDYHFSDAGRREADLEGLRELGIPKCIVWLVAKLSPKGQKP